MENNVNSKIREKCSSIKINCTESLKYLEEAIICCRKLNNGIEKSGMNSLEKYAVDSLLSEATDAIRNAILDSRKNIKDLELMLSLIPIKVKE